jgi:pyruvate/2-oxoglutarate dehydrogenase complex dihydrolipoamide acyltransferase (E2) component
MRLEPPPAQVEGAGAGASAAAADTRPLLCISVRDGGRGMTPAEAAGCFAAGHAAPAAAGGGTGLGLYSACPHRFFFTERAPPFLPSLTPHPLCCAVLCCAVLFCIATVSSAFATVMGGKLTVESALGQGSTFTLRVPVRILDAHELEAAAEAAAAAAVTEAARVAAAEEQQRGRAAAAAAVAAAAAAAAATAARDGASAQTPTSPRSPRRRLHILVAVGVPILCAFILTHRSRLLA